MQFAAYIAGNTNSLKQKSWIIFTYSPNCWLLCFTVRGFFKISSKLGAFIVVGTKMIYSIFPIHSKLGIFILVHIDVYVLRLVRKDVKFFYMLVM